MRATRTAAAAALALALLAGGCGGDDDSEQFREGYNAAVDKLRQINTDIGQAAGGAASRSNDAIAKEFESIAAAAQDARSDLAELEPPEDAGDEFDRLLAALEKAVEDLKAVAAAARKGDPGAAREAVQSLSRSGEEITHAENAVKRAVDG